MGDLLPSGEQHRIAAGNQELVVVEVGGGIRTYRCAGSDVIDGYRAHEMCSAGRGQILAPWPNRLGDGRFEWEGRAWQVPLDEPERSNAIHGLVRWLPWSLDERGESWLRMGCRLHPRPGWPWPMRLSATYSLGEGGLEVVFSAVNEGGAGACPFGLGWHPYLAAFGGAVDELLLRLPADRAYVGDDRGLPVAVRPVEELGLDFRDGRLIGGAQLDTGFTDLARSEDGRTVVEIRGQSEADVVQLWMDASYTHVMVYTGDTLSDEKRRRRGLAVEPMTCAPDMLRNGDGLLKLDEGQTFQGFWGLRKLKF
ncbi:MAG TPA: aldose 1-epimerase family protein [Acidimicrobiales bacterium]|nr:aldose 1-epimerase family protein [Acidimicrobiales bacterium]